MYSILINKIVLFFLVVALISYILLFKYLYFNIFVKKSNLYIQAKLPLHNWRDMLDYIKITERSDRITQVKNYFSDHPDRRDYLKLVIDVVDLEKYIVESLFKLVELYLFKCPSFFFFVFLVFFRSFLKKKFGDDADFCVSFIWFLMYIYLSILAIIYEVLKGAKLNLFSFNEFVNSLKKVINSWLKGRILHWKGKLSSYMEVSYQDDLLSLFISLWYVLFFLFFLISIYILLSRLFNRIKTPTIVLLKNMYNWSRILKIAILFIIFVFVGTYFTILEYTNLELNFFSYSSSTRFNICDLAADKLYRNSVDYISLKICKIPYIYYLVSGHDDIILLAKYTVKGAVYFLLTLVSLAILIINYYTFKIVWL